MEIKENNVPLALAKAEEKTAEQQVAQRSQISPPFKKWIREFEHMADLNSSPVRKRSVSVFA